MPQEYTLVIRLPDGIRLAFVINGNSIIEANEYHTPSHDYTPSKPGSDRCKYFSNNYLMRCAVHPEMTSCEGCRDFEANE